MSGTREGALKGWDTRGRGHHAVKFSIRQKRTGQLLHNRIFVGGESVGHISGFETGGAFRIYRTELSKPVLRGTGLYRRALQRVANRYRGGAFVYADDSSPQLQSSIRKMKTGAFDIGTGRGKFVVRARVRRRVR